MGLWKFEVAVNKLWGLLISRAWLQGFLKRKDWKLLAIHRALELNYKFVKFNFSSIDTHRRHSEHRSPHEAPSKSRSPNLFGPRLRRNPWESSFFDKHLRRRSRWLQRPMLRLAHIILHKFLSAPLFSVLTILLQVIQVPLKHSILKYYCTLSFMCCRRSIAC